MPYGINLKSAAGRDFDRLPQTVKYAVGAAIDALADEPRPHGVMAVPPHRGVLRFREGNYRIVYRVHDDRQEVEVLLIGDRREVYRKLPDRL